MFPIIFSWFFIEIKKMRKNSYESLSNEKEESSGDDSSIVVRKKDKSSLRIRLNRVFSSGGDLKSPKSSAAASSLTNSRGSSPARLSPFNKSSRYSWQSCNFSSKESPRSPVRSPVALSPKKFTSGDSLPPPSPQSPAKLTPSHETRWEIQYFSQFFLRKRPWNDWAAFFS